MARLALFLLGPPRVELDGAPARFDTRKAMALLAVLAFAEGPVGRDTVAALLWPDYAQARAALRRTLSALQAVIGFDWIISDSHDLSLRRSDNLFIDLDAFRDQLQAARTGSLEGRRARLRDAAQLYRDDFLAGFTLRDSAPFDEWQRSWADRLRRDLADVLEQLSALDVEAGALTEAIASAGRWLSLDLLNEPAHRALMRLYARAGQRSAAVQQYRECVRVLDRELGVAPLEETTRLYRELVEGRPPTQTSVLVDDALTMGARPVPPATPMPLVGREREWMTLDRAFDGIGQDGALIILEGPAGVGKTRLMLDWFDEVRLRGAVAVVARCHEGEASLAFAPIVSLLQQALALPGAAERLKSVPAWLRGAAAHLVPELGDATAGLPPDAADARLRVFEAVWAVLLALTAGAGATLIAIDDLQWADASTLELFAYMARRLHGRAIGLVAAWRDDAVPHDHSLRALLAAQRRSGTVVHLTLPPLERDAVAALVAGLPDVGDDLAGPLFAESRGLPLLLVAYLAALREGAWSATDGGELPGAIREILQARLARASSLGAQLLAAAAVIGRSFDAGTLRVVSGRSEDEVVSGIEELVRLGLLEEGAAYDFAHSRLRDLTYASLSLARRRLLHRRVAEALAGRERSEDDGVMANHLERAGEERQAALAYARAGAHAQRLAATSTALQHFDRALALGHPEPATVLTQIGDLLTREGSYDDALERYESAAALSTGLALAALEARIAEVHRRRGEWALASEHVSAGLAAVTETPDVVLEARLTADLSLTTYQAGDRGRARDLARTALALAEGAGDPSALAQAHNLLGLIAREDGDLDAAVDHLERSRAVAQSLGDVDAHAAALHNLALARADAGSVEQALALAEEALILCEAQGDRHRAAALLNTQADLLHRAGRKAESMDRLKQAVARFAAIGGDPRQAAHPGIWQLNTW